MSCPYIPHLEILDIFRTLSNLQKRWDRVENPPPSYTTLTLIIRVIRIRVTSMTCLMTSYVTCSSCRLVRTSSVRTTRDWEPVTNALQALSLVEKAEPVQVQCTLHLRDQRSMWMHDGCKVYMDSYMISNGSCFMVTWIIFKNHLLEVGLT